MDRALLRGFLRPMHRSDLAASAAAAEEALAAVGFEARRCRYPAGISSCSSTSPVCGLIRLSSLSSPSQVACHSSPSTQVTPVTKRLDSMVRRIAPVLRIDLVDLAVPVLPDPERAFRPGESRVAAAAGGRDRVQHAAGLRIDLLDAVLGDLEQVLAVEGRAGMRGHVERAHGDAAVGIDARSACRRRRPRCSGRQR